MVLRLTSVTVGVKSPPRETGRQRQTHTVCHKTVVCDSRTDICNVYANIRHICGSIIFRWAITWRKCTARCTLCTVQHFHTEPYGHYHSRWGSQRRPTPWPRRTALLDRSAGDQLESCWTRSSHLLPGRPGRRFQVLLGRRPSDALIWQWRARRAGTLLASRAVWAKAAVLRRAICSC